MSIYWNAKGNILRASFAEIVTSSLTRDETAAIHFVEVLFQPSQTPKLYLYNDWCIPVILVYW